MNPLEPSTRTEYENVPEVVSQTNPIFLYSSGGTDTEQVIVCFCVVGRRRCVVGYVNFIVS